MSRFLITTTIRSAEIDQPSGYVYVFDLETEKAISRSSVIEPGFRKVDPNPRGGLRGGKGIAICGDQLFLANSAAVFRFDRHWNFITGITHPSCSGIHDIAIDSDQQLWVTSSRNDLLFKFDLEGNLLSFINFRINPMLRDTLAWRPKKQLSNQDIIAGRIDFRDPRTHVLTDYDRAHVNSITIHQDGSLLISLGLVSRKSYAVLMKVKDQLIRWGLWSDLVKINQRIIKRYSIRKDLDSDLVIQPAKGKSVIVRLHPDQVLTTSLVLNKISVPSHSVISISDTAGIYLNTSSGEVIEFDLHAREIISAAKISRNFLRGIVKINNSQVLIGAQNSLLVFDTKQRQVVKEILLTKDDREAIFAIHHFPEFFSMPPASLEDLTGRIRGYTGGTVDFEG